MAASFSFAYLFLMGIFWVTTMLPPNAAGALGSFALACRTCMPICLFAAVFATTTKIGDLTAALYGMRLPKALSTRFWRWAMSLRICAWAEACSGEETTEADWRPSPNSPRSSERPSPKHASMR